MSKALTRERQEVIKKSFETDGFYIAREVVDPSLIQSGSAHMDAVIAGEYETGVPPLDLTKLATAEQLEHLKSNPSRQRSARSTKPISVTMRFGDWCRTRL
jgi:hypothetical protein